VVGGVLVLAAAVTVGAVAQMSRPSVGRMVTAAGAASTTPSATPSTRVADGKYIRFSYPASYRPPTAAAPNGGLETWRLVADAADTSLTVAVSALPTMSYIDDSAYNMRRAFPAKYAESDAVLGGHPAKLMRAADTAEVVLFSAVGGRLVTVALTSVASSVGFDADLAVIENNFTWK